LVHDQVNADRETRKEISDIYGGKAVIYDTLPCDVELAKFR